MKTAAEILEAAADKLDDRHLGHDGLVLASGFSRLLRRLRAPVPDGKPTHKTHDVGPYVPKEPDGSDQWRKNYPARLEKEPEKPNQLQMGKMVQFGIISAYRNRFSHAANMKRSVALLKAINNTLGHPGAYKLIGHWKEEGASEDTKEDSFLIIKPDHMSYETFEQKMILLGLAVNQGEAPRGDPRKEEKSGEKNPDDDRDTQDSVLLCDGETIWLIKPKSGEKTEIGTGFSTQTEAEAAVLMAYSRMRNKPNIPFVFAGTQQPGDNGGAYLMTHQGLRFFSGVSREEYAASQTVSTYFGVS